MLPGETMGKDVVAIRCPCCSAMLKLDVQKSAAGYYLGYFCYGVEESGPCGPISRESGYYRTREEARADINSFIHREEM